MQKCAGIASRYVKLVDSGTDNISRCLVLYAIGTLNFDSIVS